MKKNKVILRLLIFFLISSFLSGFLFLNRVDSQESIDINATIQSCTIQLTVYPEKRIPVTNNWGTELDVEIYNSSGTLYLGTLTGTSNFLGTTFFDACDESIAPNPADYTIYVRGKSHLRTNYGAYELFDDSSSFIDLSDEAELIAGETSNIYDNFINALDVSTQIATLETNDDKNDLNQDGEVNVLDISTTIANYLTEGDCSPEERDNDICN